MGISSSRSYSPRELCENEKIYGTGSRGHYGVNNYTELEDVDLTKVKIF